MSKTEKTVAHSAKKQKDREHDFIRFFMPIPRSSPGKIVLPLGPLSLVDEELSFAELIEKFQRGHESIPTFQTKRFSLRKARPDVLEFLISQVRIPVSQRKLMEPALVVLLERAVKVQSNEDFYRAFLDVVEQDPAKVFVLMNTLQGVFLKKTNPTKAAVEKVLFDFAPFKLAIKTYAKMDDILKIAERDGIAKLSTYDLVGVFFSYGMTFGMSAHKLVETCRGEVSEAGTVSEDASKQKKVILMKAPVEQDVASIQDDQSFKTLNARAIEQQRIDLLCKLACLVEALRASTDVEMIASTKETLEYFLDWQERSDTLVHTREICARLSNFFKIGVVILDPTPEKISNLETLVTEAEKLNVCRDELESETLEEKARINEALTTNNWGAIGESQKRAKALQDKIFKIDAELKPICSRLEASIAVTDMSRGTENIGSDESADARDQGVEDDDHESADTIKTMTPSYVEEPSTEATPNEVKEHTAPSSFQVEKNSNIDRLSAVNKGDSARENTDEESLDTNQPKDLAMSDVFTNLIRNDHLGIAARLSKALEREDKIPAVSACSLWLAAGGRISFESYDSSTQSFQDYIIPAEQDEANDANANAIIFGALLRPAILQPATMARKALGRLSLGSYAASVGGLAQAIVTLDFSFSPTLDDIGCVAGRAGEARRPRVKTKLIDWAETTIMRQGPCQPSTALIHNLSKTSGEFGKVVDAIKNNQIKHAEALAHEVIARFETHELINARVREINHGYGTRSKGRLPTITMTYIYRRLDEGRNLLKQWVDAVEEERRKPVGDTNLFKHLINKLDSCARNAIENLKVKASSDDLEDATCHWLIRQIEDMQVLLSGQMPDIWMDIHAARTDELNLLPLLGAEDIETQDKVIIEFMSRRKVPTIEEAIQKHSADGSFRKAARLLWQMRDPEEKEHLAKQVDKQHKQQISDTHERVVDRINALREIGKVDLNHPEQIHREISRLETIRNNLKNEQKIKIEAFGTLAASDIPADVDQILLLLVDIDSLVLKIKADIHYDQQQQLNVARDTKPHLVQEIDDLIAGLKTLPLDHIEDQIALIRDDRAIGRSSIKQKGHFDTFFPSFVKATETQSWPNGFDQYSAALEKDDRLPTQGDRLEVARELMANWFKMAEAATLSKASTMHLKSLLQDLSFQDVAPRKGIQVQSCKAWLHVVNMKVPDDINRGWFMPPVFGSKSNNLYTAMVMHPSVLMEQVIHSLKTDVPTFIFVTGRLSIDRRKDIAQRLRQQGVKALLIDETLMAFIAFQKQDRLKVLFDCGLPFGRIEPYITDAGKLPPEMFFGRKQEIAKIIGRDAEGILVYGGRQLGKSALLAQVEELYHKPKEGRLVIREDVKSLGTSSRHAAEIWSIMADKLRLHGVVGLKSNSRDVVVADVKRWIMEQPNRQILCLFDETDSFMAYEAKNDFPNLMHIKMLMENTNRDFKAVFAGLHHVQRMFKSSNSPLAHFGTEICVGPLNRTHDDRVAAYRLLVEPMRAAGFQFDSDSVPDEILSYVNHYPSLAQVYAKELISHMYTRLSDNDNGPLWTIPHDMLFEGEGFKDIEAGIRKKFSYTLDLDPRYKLIAYGLGFYLKWQANDVKVLHKGLTTQEIRTITEEYWPKELEPIPLADMKTILDEMFDFGILGRIEHRHQSTKYCLRTRQVANMLGTEYQIIEELSALQEVEPPMDYNPVTNRRVMCKAVDLVGAKTARHLSPLTDRQLQILLDDERFPGSRFVTGSTLLGLDYVAAAIKDYAETLVTKPNGNDIQVIIAKTEKDFAKALRDEPKYNTQIKVVVYMYKSAYLGGIDKLVAFSDERPAVQLGSIRPILVLNAENPELREIAIRREALALRPWGGEMLRTYLELIEEKDGKSLRDTILEKSGGVPDEIVRILSEIRKDENHLSAAQAIMPLHLEAFADQEATLKQAVALLLECSFLIHGDGEDETIQAYNLANEEIRTQTGIDLETIGYELLTLGFLDRFEPKEKKFRVTRLGRLLAGLDEGRGLVQE